MSAITIDAVETLNRRLSVQLQEAEDALAGVRALCEEGRRGDIQDAAAKAIAAATFAEGLHHTLTALAEQIGATP